VSRLSCWCHQLSQIRHSLSCCGVTSQHPSLFEATEKCQKHELVTLYSRFLRQWQWRLLLSGMWLRVFWCRGTNVSDKLTVSYVCPDDGCSRFIRNVYILKYVYILYGKVQADWFRDAAQTSPGCLMKSKRHNVARYWGTCNCTGMRRITTFRSTTGRIYDCGPIRLRYYNILLQ
jgi:hypothetical protein